VSACAADLTDGFDHLREGFFTVLVVGGCGSVFVLSKLLCVDLIGSVLWYRMRTRSGLDWSDSISRGLGTLATSAFLKV
jgi:hypothetical protein